MEGQDPFDFFGAFFSEDELGYAYSTAPELIQSIDPSVWDELEASGSRLQETGSGNAYSYSAAPEGIDPSVWDELEAAANHLENGGGNAYSPPLDPLYHEFLNLPALLQDPTPMPSSSITPIERLSSQLPPLVPAATTSASLSITPIERIPEAPGAEDLAQFLTSQLLPLVPAATTSAPIDNRLSDPTISESGAPTSLDDERPLKRRRDAPHRQPPSSDLQPSDATSTGDEQVAFVNPPTEKLKRQPNETNAQKQRHAWQSTLGWAQVSRQLDEHIAQRLPLLPFWIESQEELEKLIKRTLTNSADRFQGLNPEKANFGVQYGTVRNPTDQAVLRLKKSLSTALSTQRASIKKALTCTFESQIREGQYNSIANLLASVRNKTFSDSVRDDGMVQKWSSSLFIAVMQFFLNEQSVKEYLPSTEIPRALIQLTYVSAYFLILYSSKKELEQNPDADFALTDEERGVEYSAKSLQKTYDEAGEHLKNPDLDSLEKTVLG